MRFDRNRLKNKMYNSAVALYIFQSVCVFMSLETSIFRIFLSGLTYIILLLLIVSLILSKYSKKEFLATLLLLVYGMYSFYATTDSSFLFFIAFILCAKDIDEEQMMKVALRAFILAICLGLIFYFVGISPDVIKYKNDGTPVHSYGFKNPNNLGLLAIQPLLLWIYFKYNRFRLRDYIGVAVCGVIIYLITKCRSALVTVLFLLFLIPNVSAFSKKRGIEKILKGLVLLPVICAVISFLLPYLFSNGNVFVNLLDVSLSGRLMGSSVVLKQYGLPMLPYVDNPVYTNRYTLDNSFVRLAAYHGIISLVVVLMLYTKSMNKMYRNNRFESLLVLSAVVVLSLFETSLYRIVINIAILLLGEALFVKDASNFTIENDE